MMSSGYMIEHRQPVRARLSILSYALRAGIPQICSVSNRGVFDITVDILMTSSPVSHVDGSALPFSHFLEVNLKVGQRGSESTYDGGAISLLSLLNDCEASYGGGA